MLVSTYKQRYNTRLTKCRRLSQIPGSKFPKINAFVPHGTTNCRKHIRNTPGHYEIYHKLCKEAGIEENEKEVPAAVLKARAKEAAEKLSQTKLDFTPSMRPKEFSKEGIVHEMTKMIVLENQVSVVDLFEHRVTHHQSHRHYGWRIASHTRTLL